MIEKVETPMFYDVVKAGPEGIRGFIAEVERMCKEFGEPIDVQIRHHFSKDVYAREMTMPRGAMVVGKIHKHENLCIISSGEVSVLSVDGLMRVKAPFTFVAQAGAKRLIYAHEETVWTVVHGTSETDIEKIENEFIAKNYDEVEASEEKLKLEESTCLG